MVMRLLAAAAAASKHTRRKVRKLRVATTSSFKVPLWALTNGGALAPSFLNSPGFEEYKGAVYKFIA
jgi:hypothetical protein